MSASLYGFQRREGGDGMLFSSAWYPRVCGNDSKLHQKRFRLNIRKHLFTEKVVKHWNRFSREMFPELVGV